MRANTRMSSDDLMLAQVRRAQELRQRQPAHPDDDSMEVIAYCVVAGIVWTFVLVVYWIG